MEILPRSAWDAGLPVPPAPALGTVRYAVVHHTALAGGAHPDEVPGLIRAVRDLHVLGNGWDDVGYNLLVDRWGRCWEGRAGGVERPVVGAHALGHNDRSTGIAVLGDHTDRPPSAEAAAALRRLLDFKLGLHGLRASDATVVPHGRLADTVCPGRVLAESPRLRPGAGRAGVPF